MIRDTVDPNIGNRYNTFYSPIIKLREYIF